MSIPKVVGLETEYGISQPGAEEFNPVLASSMLISAYAGNQRRIRWDYDQESPMRDARGFEPAGARESVDEDTGLANVLLPNGSRYYVDHAHPEYSTPECLSVRAAVAHDKAGELVLERSIHLLEAQGGPSLAIYKNNSDGKGNAYGAHENYLMARETPFQDIVRYLTAFFVTRQIFAGAGKVGHEGTWGRWDDGDTFQFSQRADFFEAEVGLETTLKRPIINTRDEPHADSAVYRRLHVIVGDANMSETSIFLKVGTTALVLKTIEDGAAPEVALANPVQAIHDVARDLGARGDLPMAEGGAMHPLAIQQAYLDACRRWVESNEDTPENREVLLRWSSVLEDLEGDRASLATRLDWAAKLALLEGYRERDGLAWSDPKLRLIDLQYHDVRREKSLYQRLVDAGKMERLVDPAAIDTATVDPPEDTRAYFRGRCIERFPDAVAAASWDSLILDTGEAALQRLPMREPLRGTRAHVEALLDAAETPAELVALLRS